MGDDGVDKSLGVVALRRALGSPLADGTVTGDGSGGVVRQDKFSLDWKRGVDGLLALLNNRSFTQLRGLGLGLSLL